MARPRRPQIAGGIYHISSRGIRQLPIFHDNRDREYFLKLLADVAARYRWIVHAYCLMGNHYHLVVETPEANISKGMERLNGIYARRFNWRHGFHGHLFEQRFHHVLVESDWHLLALAGYLPLNPVRAGIVPHARLWRWSSYRAAVALTARPAFLAVDRVLELFHDDRRKARAAFRAFVESAAPP
jgi:REP element-mobilizing transposase RayT